MPIHLERRDLINTQQMELAVDGTNHLILCTGIANSGSISQETYTFLVGPQILRRQFARAIASGALSTIEGHDKNLTAYNHGVQLGANLILIDANYDDESGQVKERAEVVVGPTSLGRQRFATFKITSPRSKSPTFLLRY